MNSFEKKKSYFKKLQNFETIELFNNNLTKVESS